MIPTEKNLWKEKEECIIPTKYGKFNMAVYKPINPYNQETIIYYKGDIVGKNDLLVRVHSECITGEVFGSLRCDCGPQLSYALERINEEGAGLIIYLRQEGRGIGLINKVKAYQLQERGYNTLEANELLGLPADARTYEWPISILNDLKIKRVRLMTNNPLKSSYLIENGIEVTDIVPTEVGVCDDNFRYLKTKKEKMGHLLSLGG